MLAAPSIAAKNKAIITIDDAIKYALKRNFSHLKSVNQLKEAKARTFAPLGKLTPDLSANASFRYDIKKQLNSDIILKIPLIDAQSWLQLKSAKEYESSSCLRLLHQEDELIFRVMTLYIEALIAQKALELINEGVINYQKQVQVFEHQVQVGTARNLDLLEALYQLNVAEHNLITSEQRLREKMIELGQELALKDDFLLNPFDIHSPHLDQNLQHLQLLAKNTPDIRALTLEIKSYNSLIISDHLQFLPSIVGGFEKGFTYDRQFSERTYVMLNLNWQIFNIGNLKSRLSNETFKSNSEISLQQKLLEKELKVNGAISAISALKKAQEKNDIIVDLAQKATLSTERSFKQGEATGLMVIDAQSKYFQAKNQREEDRLNLTLKKSTLLFLIGEIKNYKQTI